MLKSDIRQSYVHYIGQSMLRNPASRQEGGELQSPRKEKRNSLFLTYLSVFFIYKVKGVENCEGSAMLA